MNCKIYLRKGDRNMATSFYIDILENALKSVYPQTTFITDVRQIEKNDLVCIISMYAFLDVFFHRMSQPIIYWWQGVLPEELGFNIKRYTFRLRLRIWYYAIWEFLLLRKAKLNIFVSAAMHRHYKKKYHYKGENIFIMPCFNQNLTPESFFIRGKYDKPSFVYAGGMAAWQCIEEMIRLYCMIKNQLSDATLTLLTGEIIEARRLINKYQVQDVTIKCVPVAELNQEQAKYKYGFLLRADNVVNKVATPTKFNSYLASGVIPVMSNVIDAYQPIIEHMQYVICMKDEKDIVSAYNSIIALEKQKITPEQVLLEYQNIFNMYYNTDKYILDLSACLIRYCS